MKKHFRLQLPVACCSTVTTFPRRWPRQQVSSEANDWLGFWFAAFSSSCMLHSVEPCLLAGWLVGHFVCFLVSLVYFLLFLWLVWLLVGQFSFGWWLIWFVCLCVLSFLVDVFCLFVSTKLRWRTVYHPESTPLTFGEDLDQGNDAGVFFSLSLIL